MSNNDKNNKNFIHSPLLIAVVTSTLLVTAYSASEKDRLFSYYNYDYKMPILTLAMRGAADGATPFYVTQDYIDMVKSQDADYYIEMTREGQGSANGDDNGLTAKGENGGSGEGSASSGTSSQDQDEGSASAGTAGSLDKDSESSSEPGQGSSASEGSSGSVDGSETGASSSVSEDSSSDASEAGSSSEREPEEKFPYMTTTGTVDADYFSDALFIGDSRTVGLSEYCAELDEQATFYGKTSLSIYEAKNKAFVKTSGGKVTLAKALEGKDYKKVYIMVGINEIGYGSTDGWISSYTEVIETIQSACPDAIISLQAIMHVTREYDNTKAPDASINGVINTRSQALSALADNKRIFYLNINEALDDELGDLQADISFDGVHLKASAYSLWYEYLRTHVAEEPHD